MRKFIWLLAFVPSIAYAEVPCMPLDAALGELTGPRYNEVPLFDATVPNPQGEGSAGVSVTANAKTGTWSMLIIPPGNRMACIVMAGKDFKPSSLVKSGKPL